MAGSLSRKCLNGGAARLKAMPAVSIEALEGRRLLSASAGAGLGAPSAAHPTAAVSSAVQTFGVTVQLQAGQAFDGYLGDVTGVHVSTATGKISASINWGDHSPAIQGAIGIGASGHIDVGGTHTYAAAGTYSITIAVSAAPVPVAGQPTPAYVVLLGTINSKAVVAGTPAGTSGAGIEIAETANVPFSATVGSFNFAAPGQGLSATIDWGDGTFTAATLKAAAGTGLVRFNVEGTHSYAKPGEFAIHIVVSQKSGSTSKQVASISSKAVVTSAITGTYKVAASNPDAGATYQFTGTGVTGNLPLTFAGSVTLPGLVASGSAAGMLTLKTSEGSVTFNVTGPAEKGFGPFPTALKFVIAGSTGMFAGSTGAGTIAVALNTSAKTFVFTIENVATLPL